MTTPKTPYEEYLEQVNKRLNVFEQISAGLTSSDERIDFTNKLLFEVIKVLNELKILLKFPIEKQNPLEIASQKLLVTTAGTAVQFPHIDIPYDWSVVIKALTSNTGTIYIGNSKVDAEDTSIGFPLLAGESVMLKLKDLSQIWANASVDGEGVAWIVEGTV